MSKMYTAKDIQVLRGLEGVRKRPSMYIGSTGKRGLHHLIYEVVDNSIDEALEGYCTEITVKINKDGSVTVADNGRGIPIDIHPEEGRSALEVVMTTLHAGGKFSGQGYKISGGLHGVGVSVVNALSEWLEVRVKRHGNLYFQRYERGASMEELKIIGRAEGTGTEITFYPDMEVFSEINFESSVISYRLMELAYLNKGLKITFIDERKDPPALEVYKFDNGIVGYVNKLNKTKKAIHNVIYFEGNKNGVSIECAMQYTTSYEEDIRSFVNTINTVEGGTHLAGFKLALTRKLNDYARKFGKLKEKDGNLAGSDVREGLTAVISIKMHDPEFEGQTKTRLGNENIKEIMSTFIKERLDDYSELHQSEIKAIIDRSIKAAQARLAAKKAREMVRRKNGLEGSSLPGKLADCIARNVENAELFLVEGDSAGGSAKQGRDREFQAILPLRGKILNVEKSSMNKLLKNPQITDLIVALGTNIGDDFAVKNLRYGRIIIMTDADVDGAHIRTLLLTFFYRYMRELIEEKRIFIALPPLYRLKIGSKDSYFYDDESLESVVKELTEKNKKFQVQRYKGLGEMNPEQLWETTMDPSVRRLIRVRIEDAEEANELFDKLMGSDVELRRDFIRENAVYAKDIDI